MSDADKLRQAMQDCAEVLAVFVGLDHDTAQGPSIHQFDAGKRANVTVRRDQIPEVMWRAAIMGLDFLCIGLGFTDPDAPESGESFEEELRAFLGGGGK